MSTQSVKLVCQTQDDAKYRFGRINMGLDEVLKKAAAAVSSCFGPRQIAEFLRKEGKKCR